MKSAGHNLISEVYRWAGALKDEMWVFQDGGWSKDKPLWGAIRDATWDEIVLETEFLEGLRRDTQTFFANRKIYKNLGVVWKRGLLLLGPPGNGKTESIKVLLKESGQAALYVKSFTTQDGPELGVRRIFDHARANAPCILVIEDLDSLVTSDVRAFFLNELDGLGQNEGILTIATTNHPERIDDAILNRPSRFDVKYNFDLPTEKLRVTYASKWIRKITALTTDEEGSSGGGPIVQFEKNTAQLAEEVAKETEGWSFAFLKEL
ncbi:P-loop containing nucleoside triphosphate hydrolase protein [Fomitiporia mediterranea MF3/22]|uniref:P-loop containing nucleoside triphosphate hydrolase protein n=1 Tax=Fomitiporia mediterranea (strain MF3/22) TaxID=694068 RepID=UPI0004409385|nr:P-loop containing nucleoside triphosphate hydrolase protein [Fomitiporia mediterranea MF3/22]EJC98776.1 P-loop containing nucleoside triphosphate hydrolase protein [Fomitiporia mediterranea MF3/22]